MKTKLVEHVPKIKDWQTVDLVSLLKDLSEMIQFSGLTLLEVLCVSIGKDTTSAASSGM